MQAKHLAQASLQVNFRKIMGCGKSKHDDVATGNTIVTRKKSINNNVDVSQKNKETETAVVDDYTKSLVEQKEGGHEDVKDAGDQNTEFNEDQLGGGGGGGDQENVGGGRLISKESPNRFFSSRKEEEAIDAIVYEGRSEKSEYLTPRIQDAGKETAFSFDEVEEGLEETKLVEESTSGGQTKNEVGLSEKKEENLVKETEEKEKAKATEAEVLSAPAAASVEKNLNAEREQSVASPIKDQKTI